MGANGPDRKVGGKTDWETPDELVEFVEENLKMRFTIDGAASKENAKCERFYTEEFNAFEQEPIKEVIWLNPPYGSHLIEWIGLAGKWSLWGNTIAVLVPASPDTAWFQEGVRLSREIWFLYPRVQFVGSTSSNTSGSTVFIMRPPWEPGFLSPPETKYLKWR